MPRAKRLREIDLNLLPVLRSLLQTHSVARTGAALSLTPSAVSHALGRLRTTLQDELFVRGPSGLVPTPRVAQLAAELDAGLATIERALGKPAFVPRSASVSFRVATTDFGARMTVPALLATLDAEAPGMQVQVRPIPIDSEDALANGDIDLLIGPYAKPSANLYRRTLFEEHTVVLAHRDHARVKRAKISLDDYLACSHILIAPRGRPGSRIDDVLLAQGHARRIAVTIPDFLLGPHIVAETELVLSAGKRLLDSFVGLLPVQVVPLPLELPPFDVHMVWHARLHNDPAFEWFRDRLATVHEIRYKPRA